jgi:CheY-like chemotaxis protein
MTKSPSPLRVLVLEDEFIIADEIASMLEEAGHSVIGPAASIDEAMSRLAGDEMPDVAIIDANLRGVSSLPVAERLRASAIPFCICTGYRSADLQRTFGDTVVLQKPVTPRALLAALQSLAPAE